MFLLFTPLPLITLHYLFNPIPMADLVTIRVGHTCSIDYEGDKVVFNPDSAVMKSSYSYYRFDKSDFKGVDLNNLEKPFEIEARCQLTSSGKSVPNDPYMAQPIGGFDNAHYDCKLVELKKNA